MKNSSHKTKITLCFFLTLIGLALAPLVGGETIPFRDLLNADTVSHRIFWELRVPRSLMACLTGGSLAILGGTYQILFRNDLAEPYLLGISGAVMLGVAISEILFHSAPFSITSAATGFTFALCATVFLGVPSLFHRSGSIHRLVLFGMGMNFVLSSALFLLLSYHSQQLGGGSLRYLFGFIPWTSYKQVGFLGASTGALVLFLVLFSRALDALSLGDPVARSLGYSPAKTRWVLLVITSLFIAISVTFTGSIGFIGLIIPHAARLIFRPPTTRLLFVYASMGGALFLTWSDVLSRAILPPLEFPIGIITTLIGGPLFLMLLWKRQNLYQ